MASIKIDNEFKALIPPLSVMEVGLLEDSIIAEGCRDALIVWKQEGILLDGHHRHKICSKHGIPYRVEEYDFNDREEARIWRYKNQLGRRNLTDEQRSYYRGKYATASNTYSRGGDRKSKGHCVPLISRGQMASEEGISEKTIDRDVKYMHSVDAIAAHSPELKDSILSGETGASKKDIMQFGAVMRDTPGIGEAAIDELVAGNAKTFKQAMILARNEDRKLVSQNLPDKIYNVIYADPPWEYDNVGVHGNADSHYPTMALDKICSFLEDIDIQIDDNAVLFMWVTNPFLQDAFKVVFAWGFKYKTNIVWIKTDLVKPGSGFYVRGRHELLFICTRGAFTPLDKNISPPIGSVIEAAVQEHSSKPDDAYDIIERLYPGCSYVELFARGEREGWDVYGNELN